MVICLSTTVRNDTLQDAKEHRVSVKCRKQLRVEEVEMVSLPSAMQLRGFIHLTFLQMKGDVVVLCSFCEDLCSLFRTGENFLLGLFCENSV